MCVVMYIAQSSVVEMHSEAQETSGVTVQRSFLRLIYHVLLCVARRKVVKRLKQICNGATASTSTVTFDKPSKPQCVSVCVSSHTAHEGQTLLSAGNGRGAAVPCPRRSPKSKTLFYWT